MKIILSLILFTLFSHQAFAGRGVVIVLQAPLLDKESFQEGKPVSHVRRGQEIFIHDKHFGISSFQITFEGMADDEEVDKVEDGWDKEGFFQTLDASGNIAYIERKYVKLIYKDMREQQSYIKPFKYDPTDYRLEEPLPKSYPLDAPNYYRAGAYLAFGPQPKVNYNYTRPIIREQYRGRGGIEGFYLRKVGYDPFDRFYFGGTAHFYAWESNFQFQNSSFNTASEVGGEIGIGPQLSYIFFRNHNWDMTFTGGITINYIRHLITIKEGEFFEERFFEDINVTPKLKTYVTRKNLTPGFALIAGIEVTMNLPTNYTSSTAIADTTMWQEDPSADMVNIPFGANFALIFGINSTY